MTEVTLKAQIRSETGKGAGRRLRRTGMVPAVVYGQKIPNQALQVNGAALQRLLQSGASSGLVELEIEGGDNRVVLIKDVQSEPVMGVPLHVDFHAVALDQDVVVSVPLVLTGEDVRANDGGVVAQNIRELAIHCLPTDIPESIAVDVSSLNIGESILAGDLSLPKGVRIGIDPEEVVVSVVVPDRAPEPEEAAEQEGGAEGESADAAKASAEESQE